MQNSLESVDEVENLFDRLFPIMRSIMGNGYRESLNILKEYIPFNENFGSEQKIVGSIRS